MGAALMQEAVHIRNSVERFICFPLMRLFCCVDKSSVILCESSNLAPLCILIDPHPAGISAIFSSAAVYCSLTLSICSTNRLQHLVSLLVSDPSAAEL